MVYPLLALQQAVYSVLNEDATLQNMINGVYDQAPADAVYPFITIEDARAQDWSFYGGEGVQAQFNLHIYSRYHGKSEAYSILARAHDLLHQSSLSATGLSIVQTRHEQSSVRSLSDGRTTQGDLRIVIFAYA